MGKRSLEFCLSSLIGLGFGLMIGKRKYDQLKMERDTLHLRNRCLEADRENLRKACNNLDETNRLYTKFLTREEA